MLSRIKIPALIGLIFSTIAFGVVKFFGYNSQTFLVLSYLYMILAIIIALKYEIKHITNSESAFSSLKNIVIVSEGEKMEIKRVLTGEKYRIKGEIEKIQ